MPGVAERSAPQARSWYYRTDRDQTGRVTELRLRLRALAWLRQHSCLKSQRCCSTTVREGFALTVSRRDGLPVLRHLVGCKRLDCPRCGPGAAEREAADIALAIAAHYARGGSVGFVTLTMAHVASRALKTLLGDLGKAWTSARTTRRPRALWDLYTCGYIRRLEVTFGVNGWHPHLHLLVFLDPWAGEKELKLLCESVFDTWRDRLVRLGGGEPSEERGVRWELLSVDQATEKVARYVAKDAGRELASSGGKRGRARSSTTTYELMMAGAAGDGLAGLRYLEYEDAMQGLSRVQWSQGLKAELLGKLEETADEDDEEHRDIAVFSREAEFVLRYNERTGVGPGLGQLLQWASVYDDDAEAFDLIDRCCARWGIPAPEPPWRLRQDLAALRLQLEPYELLPLF